MTQENMKNNSSDTLLEKIELRAIDPINEYPVTPITEENAHLVNRTVHSVDEKWNRKMIANNLPIAGIHF